MARIAIVFTGGTISMRRDAAAGGNVPVLGGAALLDTVPGLGDIADLVPIDRGLTPASHFTFEALFGIAGAVREAPVVPDYFSQIAAHMLDVGERAPWNSRK